MTELKNGIARQAAEWNKENLDKLEKEFRHAHRAINEKFDVMAEKINKVYILGVSLVTAILVTGHEGAINFVKLALSMFGV